MRGTILAVLGILILASVAVVPSASALPPPCGNVATVTTQGMHVLFAGIRTQLWQERNAVPGLQTATCSVGTAIHGPDTFVRQVVPYDLGVLGLCVNGVVTSQCL